MKMMWYYLMHPDILRGLLQEKALASIGEALLTDAGKISHAQAIEKAKAKYKKYQVQSLSPVEEDCLKTIRAIESAAKEGSR